MSIPRPKKVPSGYSPEKDFTSSGDPYGFKVGLVTRVDPITMKASVRILTGRGHEMEELDLTQGMAGPRSFWGGVPEVNSLVHITYRRKHKQIYEPIILGYIPVGNRLGLNFDPFSASDQTTVDPADRQLFDSTFGKNYRLKRLNLQPGDVGGMSADGAELILSKDLRLVNRAGDTLELRDSDRTLLTQSVHRVDSVSGSRRTIGPIRRGSFWLPEDIFERDDAANVTKNLRTEDSRYFGRDDLQNTGPGPADSPYKFSNSSGLVLPDINDATQFPPTTYSNGKRVNYTTTLPYIDFENPETGAGAIPYIEDRLQVYHVSDPTLEVLEEIDGFEADKKAPYIERVYGTVVGNDTSTAVGLRQYGRILKPKLFDSFGSVTSPKFTLETVPRGPTDGNLESDTTAGAYLFRMNPPRGSEGGTPSPFAVSVSKQGKLFVNVPASKIETYADGQTIAGVSSEVNMDGALKMRLGAAGPNNTSMHLKLDGGIIAEIGSLAGREDLQGLAIKLLSRCAVDMEFAGAPTDNGGGVGVGYRRSVIGNEETYTSSDVTKTVGGSSATTVNGACAIFADSVVHNGNSSYSVNAGSYSAVVSGKSQYRYALLVDETIAAGGKITTILAGGRIQTVLAGAVSYNTLAGATSFNNPAGAYSVTVGTGAITMSVASGAITLSAGAGAVGIISGAAISMSAGLAINIATPVAVSLTTPQVLLGGPAAILGISRGLPILPPGVPSLDYITGLPVMGSAVMRSA